VCLSVFGSLPLYRQASAKQQEIRTTEDEIDAVEPNINARTSGHLVTEAQRQRQIEAVMKPLIRKRERLQQEYQFIIDKLPFFKR
jgi:hypothetical protein